MGTKRGQLVDRSGLRESVRLALEGFCWFLPQLTITLRTERADARHSRSQEPLPGAGPPCLNSSRERTCTVETNSRSRHELTLSTQTYAGRRRDVTSGQTRKCGEARAASWTVGFFWLCSALWERSGEVGSSGPGSASADPPRPPPRRPSAQRRCPPRPGGPAAGPGHEPAGRPCSIAAGPAAVQQDQDEKAPEEEPEREVPTQVPTAAQSRQSHGVCESDAVRPFA